MSPHTSEFGGDTVSPFTSPPATPSNSHDMNDQQLLSTETMRPTTFHNAMRRRTFSQSARSAPVSTAILTKEETSLINDEEQEVCFCCLFFRYFEKKVASYIIKLILITLAPGHTSLALRAENFPSKR